MIRTQVAVALWLSVVPSSLFAQFEIAGRAGVHVDRAPEHDRLVTDGGAAMYADRGEASALGVPTQADPGQHRCHRRRSPIAPRT